MDDEPFELPDDEIVVPISAIEHYSYCPRQCALIHVEQTYDENVYTIRGKLAHENVDTGDDSSEAGVRTVRSVPLWSDRLRMWGKADVIEFHPKGPYPVEYKVGKRKGRHADLQLCAQALCLEEMLGVDVPKGAVFYHAARRRYEVTIDEALRRRTEDAVRAIHDLLARQQVPDAPNDSRCPRCSLYATCMPSVVAELARLRGLQGALFHAWEGGDHA